MTKLHAEYDRSMMVYWRADWRPFSWTVYVREWQYSILERFGSTTGLIMVVSPPRWIWIKFLAWCAGSGSERIRVFAMTRWKRMRVLYWRTLSSDDDEMAGLPQVGGIR